MEKSGVRPGPRGAYGLQFPQFNLSDLFQRVPSAWTPWKLTQVEATEQAETGALELSDYRAILAVQPRGRVLVDRGRALTALTTPFQVDDQSWAHPYLGSTALVHAYWAGWPTLHAAVVSVDGVAFAILGEKEDGKSTAAAWLSTQGHDIVSDDLCVVCDGMALVGPRCLDLREGAAAHFGGGHYLGEVGTRQRWRHSLLPTEPETPLAGFITLAWSDAATIERVPLVERLRVLATHRGLRRGAVDQHAWLALLALPMVVFRRPRDWATLDASMRMLVDHLTRAPNISH
jgi:hypothetical protein